MLGDFFKRKVQTALGTLLHRELPIQMLVRLQIRARVQRVVRFALAQVDRPPNLGHFRGLHQPLQLLFAPPVVRVPQLLLLQVRDRLANVFQLARQLQRVRFLCPSSSSQRARCLQVPRATQAAQCARITRFARLARLPPALELRVLLRRFGVVLARLGYGVHRVRNQLPAPSSRSRLAPDF